MPAEYGRHVMHGSVLIFGNITCLPEINIALDVLHSRRTNSGLHTLIKGLLIESYLVEGCQPLSSSQTYGQSITDPCLGWEDTETLLYRIAELCD